MMSLVYIGFFYSSSVSGHFKSLTDVPADIKDSLRPSGWKTAITKIVARYTEQYSQGLAPAAKEARDKVFVKKVRRELERIELQSGAEQAHTFLINDSQSHAEHFSKHITIEFIQRLAHSVIDNELLTDEFPIHIKHFEIERVKPLPLYIKQDNDPQGLLNAAFLRDNKVPRSVEGLARQVAYRVRVHFYIKPPDDYKVKFKNITVFQKTAGQDRLEFSEEVVGVGCAASHIIAVINRVLLWDIPILKDYIPIADGIHCNDEVMGGTPNSPVWSHCVAKLHKREDIRSAIESGKSYADFVTTAEVASADFYGFDRLETMSKAALFARLKLIKQTLAKRPLSMPVHTSESFAFV